MNRRTFILAFLGIVTGTKAPAAARNGARKSGPTAARPLSRATALRKSSEKFGGHLNKRHVGKTRASLRQRSAQSISAAQRKVQQARVAQKLAKSSKKRQEKYLAMRKAAAKLKVSRNRKISTFTNGRSADFAISSALNSRKALSGFIKSNKKQLVINVRSNKVLGTSYDPRTKKYGKVKNAKVLFRKSGTQYYVHTAYPI